MAPDAPHLVPPAERVADHPGDLPARRGHRSSICGVDGGVPAASGSLAVAGTGRQAARPACRLGLPSELGR